jgi:dienelactone hydrolase
MAKLLKFYMGISSLIFFLYGCATASDPAELQKTWDDAQVRLVYGDIGASGYLNAPGNVRDLSRLPEGVKFPTVIYLHGCRGLDWGYHFNIMGPLMELGFAFIAPDSFARTNRSSVCGMGRRDVFSYRASEAKYAAEKARELPWVDANNLFLIGHSEGGAGVAAYIGDQFNAMVISGFHCPDGIKSGIPTLAVASRNDRWLPGQHDVCLTAQERLIEPGSAHNVLRDNEVADRVIKFISKYLKPQ